MTYLSKAFPDFFKQLSANNSKEWFDANRKVYEAEVKKPFTALVEEMITRIGNEEPDMDTKAGDVIMRINNDIRFSKDKTPYKTHMAANISRFGKKDKAYPGFFFQLSQEGAAVYGGVYMAEPAIIDKIRKEIAKDLKGFAGAYKDKLFKEVYGTLLGEQQKRLPEEYKALSGSEPLIANKQWYYTAKIQAAVVTSPELADQLFAHYRAGRKVNEFLRRAF
jgi:uncharacterized protein (TIGR02453 family)